MGQVAAALTRLLGAQGQNIEDRVAGTHVAIAARVFGALGPAAAPVRAIHDGVSTSVHAAVRAALGHAGEVGGRLAGQVDDELLLASPRIRTTIGVILGLIGDTVREEEPALAWPTVLLRDGHVVAGTEVVTASPRPAREVVLLLHGLCETELSWGWGTSHARPSIPTRLVHPDRDVLLARVNSGMRPATVGIEISDLLAEMVGPSTQRVVLVGHSMGGLVARAALRHAAATDASWLARCDTLVTLGTPHLGAPLERAVEVLVRAGAMAPEVDAITRWFDQRSAGVRDLRHGSDSDEAEPGVSVRAAALPEHVTLHTVGASFGGAAGTLVGDGLVRPVSAHARGARGRITARRGATLDIVGSHFDLVVDEAVGEHVARLVAGELR